MNYSVSVLLSAMLAMSLAACQNKEESMPMPETGAISPPSQEMDSPPMKTPPPSSESAEPQSGSQPGSQPGSPPSNF